MRPLAALDLVALSLVALSLVALGLVAMIGCAAEPAPRAAYEGAPLRPAINADCGPELLDGAGRACVQVDVFAEGEGPAAAPGEWLKVHYIVTVDGQAIDSSHGREPLSVQLGESGDVIEGMHLGLDGMRVGERRSVVIPPKLGYRGRKMAKVPPDANLIFLVELVERRERL